jgi:hypothetical protein
VEAVPAVTVLGFTFTLERTAAGCVPPLLDESVLLPEKLPAVCGGDPPQPVRIRNARRMTKTKLERRIPG